MLNGLALRKGFEAAPKVRKNQFEYKQLGRFRDLSDGRIPWGVASGRN
jgi:hypothetical protein